MHNRTAAVSCDPYGARVPCVSERPMFENRSVASECSTLCFFMYIFFLIVIDQGPPPSSERPRGVALPTQRRRQTFKTQYKRHGDPPLLTKHIKCNTRKNLINPCSSITRKFALVIFRKFFGRRVHGQREREREK